MPEEKMAGAGVARRFVGRRQRSVAGGFWEDGLRTLRQVWMVLRNLCGEAAGVVEEVRGAQL